MRGIVGAIVVALAWAAFAPQSALATEVTLPPTEHRADVFISAFQIGPETGGTIDAIELYNETDRPLNIDGWRIQAMVAGQTVCSVEVQSGGAFVLPKKYVVLADPSVVTGENVREYVQPCDGTVEFDSLRVTSQDGVVQETIAGVRPGAWVRGGLTMTYRDEEDAFTDNFEPISSRKESALFAHEWYVPPNTTPIQITEVVPRAADCAPDDPALDCNDYVKIHNPTASAYDLSQLRLRIGHQTQAVTSSNTITLEGSLPAGSYALINKKDSGEYLSITDSGGWIWLENRYGIERYDASIVEYESAGTGAVGWAWAYDDTDATWKWTSTTTPFAQVSRFTLPLASTDDKPAADALKPCAADQFRNPETNRCKKIATTTSDLTPCAPNQFRNPATNRCKMIASTATALTPCGPGQFRNPETNRCKSSTSSSSSLVPCDADEYRNPATNRCKKLASTASTLKPCEPGQERNPETNRCRKVASSAVLGATDFPVEPIAQTGRAFAAWWALGGVVALGVGYAAWEWRHEISKTARRIVTRGKVE